jgi:5'-nucleotidase (lipoprotein e(P4) family)
MNLMKRIGLRRAGLGLALVLFTYSATTITDAWQQAAPQPTTDNEYTVGSTLWTQYSGEERALAYQAYHLARLLLDRDLRINRKDKRRRAVVVDVDETVLDNSRHQAQMIKEHRSYPYRWLEWINLAEASAVPGAVEFLKYADSKGVRVFYVTNRKSNEKEGTMRNLRQLGFPNITEETVVVRPDNSPSSKEARRQKIAQRHRIVLLIGDNLNDFAEVFEKKSSAERIAAVEQAKDQFGERFIMIPNAMYGDWESSLFAPDEKLSDEEKAAKRRSLLKGF